MAQPRSLTGLPAPLFEKLIDLSPNSPEDDQDLVFQTRDAVTRSILREISRVVDTRLPWTEANREDKPSSSDPIHEVDRSRTVVGYGIPDLTHLCIRSTTDRRVVERLVLDAIKNFEPRLQEPRVSIVMAPEAEGGRLEVTGNVRIGRALEPLAFGLDLEIRLEGEARRKLAAAQAKAAQGR